MLTLTEEQIQFLNRVCRNVWTETNGVISVEGDVVMDNMNLTQIPVQFENVTGIFVCSHNKLTTLKGSPSIINGYFNCENNKLTTLEGGPKEVNLYYSCARNQLTSLIGASVICNDDLYCHANQLTSLEGCPSVIKYNLYCRNNPHLKYLWGIGKVENGVDYYNINVINKWIIECMKRDIIFPYYTLEENINWIKQEQKYSSLLEAPDEIRQRFSSIILYLVDSGIC